jgi:hypothetical protein
MTNGALTLEGGCCSVRRSGLPQSSRWKTQDSKPETHHSGEPRCCFQEASFV